MYMVIDKIIMNPPYKGNLHLSILDKCISIAKEEVVNLSPIRWIKDTLAPLKENSDYYKFSKIRRHIQEIDEISPYQANESFNSIEIASSLGIYLLKSNTNSNFGIQTDYSWFLNKIFSKEGNYLGVPTIKYSDNMKNFLLIKRVDDSHKERKNVSSIPYLFLRNPLNYGLYFFNGVNPNGKTLQECKDNNKRSTRGDIHNWNVIPLETENELKNCSKFFLTDFFRFYLHCIQCGKDYHLNYILFMKDYTNPWTNERLYDFFEIESKYQKMIEETMKVFRLPEEIYEL